ncbi:unnamed protein product [Amoebophrya sp. A120]|nr:unnamed protein product [Amoebophrya sp. A120]|eukprot:GSA120T00016276001.1
MPPAGESEWMGHGQPQVELRRSYIKLPRGRVHAVPNNNLHYDPSTGEPQVGIAFVRGKDSHLVGAGTVPFLRTEETTRPGANQTLGPSGRFVGSKLYQNEWVFTPGEEQVFCSDVLEKAGYDEHGHAIYYDRPRRELKAKLAADRIEDGRRELLAREQAEHQAVENAAIQKPHYYDSYSGATLVQRNGKYVAAAEQPMAWDSIFDDLFDFDNFRIRWPYDDPDRNKLLHQDVYDWYDRANPYLERDEDVMITETASAYVEEKPTLDPGGFFAALDDVLESLKPY